MPAYLETIEIDIDVIDRAIEVIIRQQDASIQTLQRHLQIDQSTAEAVLDGLQDCGIVTGRDREGVRQLCERWKGSPRTR